MRSLFAATFILSVLAGAARANGAEDGNAGLEALHRGDNREAIRLFTRALADKTLALDDREFAYLSRSEALMAQGDVAAATRDLEQAVRLKPDDTEALARLQVALGRTRTAESESSTNGRATTQHDPWGILATWAGRYFWYDVQGQNPHIAYEYVNWITPQQSLSTVIRNKHGTAAAAETKLDADSGRLISAGLVNAGTVYSTASAGPTALVEWTWFKGHAVRTTSRLQPDGSITVFTESFDKGAWVATAHATLVEVSKDALRSEGFKIK